MKKQSCPRRTHDYPRVCLLHDHLTIMPLLGTLWSNWLYAKSVVAIEVAYLACGCSKITSVNNNHIHEGRCGHEGKWKRLIFVVFEDYDQFFFPFPYYNFLNFFVDAEFTSMFFNTTMMLAPISHSCKFHSPQHKNVKTNTPTFF